MADDAAGAPSVDLATVVGWGALLLPLLTMWHELGGHAATCAALGGRIAAAGAFYVDCTGLTGWPDRIVAIAGPAVNVLLALVAHAAWQRQRGDAARLGWWLVWVSEAFVASGYLCFSGATGIGDLGETGALVGVSAPLPWRMGELAVGIVTYVWLVRAGIRSLTDMLGTGMATRTARRRIAHGYYATCGAAAVLVGLLNPVGLFVTIASAAASSFGGLAGFISIGFAVPREPSPRHFVIERDRRVIALGAVVLAAFAILLGPG